MTADQVEQGSKILSVIETLKCIKGAIRGNNWDTVYRYMCSIEETEFKDIQNKLVNAIDSKVIDLEEKLHDL